MNSGAVQIIKKLVTAAKTTTATVSSSITASTPITLVPIRCNAVLPSVSQATTQKIEIQPATTTTKINKIFVSSTNPASAIAKDLFKQANVLPTTITTNNGNIITSQSLQLATPTNVITTDNNSYQLLFTTVTKPHPRIKYSGLKKPEDKAIILETVNVPALKTASGANILDISAITPLISSNLTPISTTITLPTTTHLPANSHIININSNDLASAIKYADIDDIELPDGTKIGYQTNITELRQNDSTSDTSYPPSIAEKYSILAASTLKNFDFTINDATTTSTATTVNQNLDMGDNASGGEEELFACRHCGKKYRWKSTLRRHENDECGNKEPSHQCPYCPYKAKQRGNLGVHVRKHHTAMPQLESKRKKKD